MTSPSESVRQAMELAETRAVERGAKADLLWKATTDRDAASLERTAGYLPPPRVPEGEQPPPHAPTVWDAIRKGA